MWVRALGAIAELADDRTTLADRLPVLAERFGSSPALIGAEGSLTYAELVAQMNRYAAWAQHQGIRPGDVVCLLMPNCADYVAIWLGIGSVGGVVALLNTGLRHESLVHAIALVAPRHLVADAALADVVEAVCPGLPAGMGYWVHGAGRPGWALLDVIAGMPWPARRAGPAPALDDTALLLFTSGTTGLPKAVPVTHRRVLEWSLWFAGMMGITPDDRMYDCLPMYHSVGGVVAVGAMLVRGGSVLIRPVFSASRFWDDVVDGRCTVFQYIGELCRYLANAPSHPRERHHGLRLACGNGLQGEVWSRFGERFQLPRILEYYAATEGGLSLFNTDQQPGALGRIPSYLAHRFPVALIRCDRATGAALRNAAGHCQRCGPDEPGEAIAPAPARPIYTDPGASEAKLLRDVFAPGDAWFRSGDLMRRDRAGFYYFVDRLGDAFRWKGENVSTAEVAGVVGACAGVLGVAIYGVAVPGMEGRAGMAAIVAGSGFSPDSLYAAVRARLPEPAWPVFLRLRRGLESTGTFKPVVADLVRDGFDPARSADPLYVLERAGRHYVRLDPPLFARIAAGTVLL